MVNSIFSSSDYSTDTLDFLKDSFLSGDKNEGYRFFTKENIKIDPENRTLIIYQDPNQTKLGASDYGSRGNIDGEFLKKYSLLFKDGFDTENKIFNSNFTTDEFKKVKNHKIETGGKLAITNNKLYIDTDGEPYIIMPLANSNITYGFSGKATSSNVIVSDIQVKVDRIIQKIGKQDISKIKNIQIDNPKEKILLKDDLELGNWTLKVISPNGKKYTKLDNCYIGRAYDGAFEVMKTDVYKSYEKLLDNLDTKEEVGYFRVNTIVKVSDLSTFLEGNIEVKKVFYKNELIDIKDLPEEFKNKFEETNGKKYIKDFSMTPPLQMFVNQVKRNIFSPEFESIRKEHKKSVQGTLNRKMGEEVEKEFGEKFNLSESPQKTEELNFHNYEEIIKNSEFNNQEKEELKKYIEKNIDKTSVIINPDFQINLSNGKKILIEYKNSKKANINKNQKRNIKLFMLFGGSENIESYNTIIGSNYGVDYQNIGHGIKIYSEKFLDEKGVNTKENLQEFLT
ncbi:MAG: hypothetical protein Q9M94_03375 [Candidatus Gracilibacteria bacterium]|nr:hypothetical protein [Candidatus Gracilibacteria bacterium]